MEHGHAQVHYEDGMYWLEVPEMPGLFASAESPEELHEALAEALALYVDSPERVELEPWSDEVLEQLLKLAVGPGRELELALA